MIDVRLEGKGELEVKKLIIGSAIAFLVIFSAGLARAGGTSTITGTGTLWFVNATDGDVSEFDGATITLNEVVPPTPNPTGQPGNMWTGTVTSTLDGTWYITALRDTVNPHLFHNITIHNGSYTLGTAEGQDNVLAKDYALTKPKSKLGFSIRGTYSSCSFEGVLFY